MSAVTIVATVSLLLGPPLLHTPVDDRPTLNLTVSDRFGFEQEFLAKIEIEVSVVFEELDVDVHWTASRGTPLGETGDNGAPGRPGGPARFRVLLAQGPPAMWNVKDRAMGVVVPSAPARRTVIVFPTRVLTVLGVERPPGAPGLGFRTTLGARAFARVIVHELVHALAPEHSHAEDGLMLGTLNRDLLQRRELRLDRECEEALLSGLRRLR